MDDSAGFARLRLFWLGNASNIGGNYPEITEEINNEKESTNRRVSWMLCTSCCVFSYCLQVLPGVFEN